MSISAETMQELAKAVETGTLTLNKSKLVVRFDGDDFYAAPFRSKAEKFIPVRQISGILVNKNFDQNPLDTNEAMLLSEWLAGFDTVAAKTKKKFFDEILNHKDFFRMTTGEYQGKKFATVVDPTNTVFLTVYDNPHFQYTAHARTLADELNTIIKNKK